MSTYENKITIGELEDDCDDVIADVTDGNVYLITDEDGEKVAVLIPYSMYEEYVGLRDMED